MNHTTTPATGLLRYQSANSTPVRTVFPIAAYNAEIIELHQHAHNALATAAWHVARGESAQAMSRIRRAQAHLAHAAERGAL